MGRVKRNANVELVAWIYFCSIGAPTLGGIIFDEIMLDTYVAQVQNTCMDSRQRDAIPHPTVRQEGETMAQQDKLYPDVEVFYSKHAECCDDCGTVYLDGKPDKGACDCEPNAYAVPGWFWWSCFPGCLPDSEPNGPFATEAEALADAQDGCDDET